jgi:hypothetical protein
MENGASKTDIDERSTASSAAFCSRRSTYRASRSTGADCGPSACGGATRRDISALLRDSARVFSGDESLAAGVVVPVGAALRSCQSSSAFSDGSERDSLFGLRMIVNFFASRPRILPRFSRFSPV